MSPPRRQLKQYEIYYEMEGAWDLKPLVMSGYTLMEVAVLAHYRCEVEKDATVIGIIEKREKKK